MNGTKDGNASDPTLPLLTSKQQKFVNTLLEGKSASDAYREAYNCQAMSNAAVWWRQVGLERILRSPYGCAIFNGFGQTELGLRWNPISPN